jgi:flagellar hook-associated protein 2
MVSGGHEGFPIRLQTLWLFGCFIKVRRSGMGTVGLSFGSPTSGAGFDVSSTVASIVSNLQNVETPWKTQLTSLESQDTAISSLGTLFSNLSNDMSSLTNLEGILAEKTGSSSDTNVLSLTAATSTAIAGTHTVTVANLAQTSSGYLAPIASATTPLTGSITLQAANGTALPITLNSSDNTLAGLASTINASGAGIMANVITDSSGSRLSLVSATSGAAGDISVSANSIATALTYTGTAATNSTNASGTMGEIANANDILSGSFSIQVGSGSIDNVVIGAAPSSPAANTIYTGSGVNTLAGLQGAIAAANLGVTATVVTNSDNTQSLLLVSNTAGSAGALTVTSNLADTTTSAMAYTPTTTGKDANLTVDGIPLTSPSNTVTNYIPGVTFQLLAPSATESDNSLEPVQVVIGNDNTDVESTMTAFVSDYNALISGINTQDGNTTSGTPEPLFGSPTLSLLQQQLLGGLNTGNPNGSLDSIADNTGTTLAGSMTIMEGSGSTYNVVVGSAPTTGTPPADTIYTGAASGYNTLAGVAAAINSANIGVTASVATSTGTSTLSLMSQTEGAAGALTVSSKIAATSDTLLNYSGTAGADATSTTNAVTSSGTLNSVPNSSDILSGSFSIQVGSGAAQTFTMNSSDDTLSGLATAITAANMGVSAQVVTNPNGSSALQLTSGTAGSAGTFNVTSSILDTTNTSTRTLNYTNSSDITSLTTLGIAVNNDGSITLDAASLDSLLNSDYSSVVGFFQNASGWGQSFSNILTNAGTSSATGILSLASGSNSNIESTLNADISKEEALISAQQKSLTAELNSANEIMQELPSQLDGVNELYSAITGYNQNSNG